VQDPQNRQLDTAWFNEAYLMHTSTSPQYSIIASCDVAAAMMEQPGGQALVEESLVEALDFRRAMRKVDEEYGNDWWFSVWGPDELSDDGICDPMDWELKPGAHWHGFAGIAEGFNLLDPIKATISRRAWTWTAASKKWAFRPPSSPSTWPSTAWWSKKPACTASSSCSPSASPRAAGTR
jgi:arginine decarboxylase